MTRYFNNRNFILLCFLLLPIASLWASTESYIQTLSGKIKKGDSCVVLDDKFMNMPLSEWNQVRHLSIDNIITFELRRDTSFYYQKKPFTCTLNVTIKYFTSRDQTTPDEIKNVDLKVRFDTVTGKVYPISSSYTFKNAFRVTVTVNSISSPEWGKDLPSIFRLSNQILIERKYPFDPLGRPEGTAFSGGHRFAGGTGLLWLSYLPYFVSVPPVGPGNQLLLSWQAVSGAEQYDVEWTYIDLLSDHGQSIKNNTAWFNGTSLLSIPETNLSSWMLHDNTRVTVSATTFSYAIDLPYAEGFVLYRVRSVSHDVNGLRQTGNWIYTGSDNHTYGSYVAAHQPSLNWQYTASFAEEGKRKEVMSYLDGSLRARQAVTISNNELDHTSDKNIAVVAETIYDNMGRATMNILPAPLSSTTLQYYPAINKNMAGQAYSRDDISSVGTNVDGSCNITAGPMSTLSGASQYYSPNNSFLPNTTTYPFAKYIPDAGQKPFSLTEYTADNTGRIRRQGGVGPMFQIRADASGGLLNKVHDTRYYYSKPSGPRDLERLFGMEVGEFSHYAKNLMVDPNGQVSVSYVDADGKTVATALAGNVPPATDTLLSAKGGLAKTEFNQTLILPTDFTIDGAGLYKSATTTFSAPFIGTDTLHYNVSPALAVPPSPHNATTFCSNCYYDITIDVKDNCGNLVAHDYPATPPFPGSDITCHDNPQVYSGNLTVPINNIGEYTVIYTLKLSEAQIRYQTDYYILNNTSLRTIQNFFEDELTKADLSGCYNECSTCIAKLGTLSDFTTRMTQLLVQQKAEKYPALPASTFDPNSTVITNWITNTYNVLYANCQSIQANCSLGSPCEQKKTQMKLDVFPGGQYALYDDVALQANVAQVFLDRTINVPLLNYHSMPEYFTDDKGNQVHTVDDNGVLASTLSEADFIRAYLNHQEWADYFVKFHIEWCSYLFCKDADNPTPSSNMEVSYAFDQNLRQVYLTADKAAAKGYFNHNNREALLSNDPFFNNGGRGVSLKSQMSSDLQFFSNTMNVYLKNYMGITLPSKDIIGFVDWMLYCNPNNSSTDVNVHANAWNNCSPNAACRSTNREWGLYRDYYLQLKGKYVQLAKQQLPAYSNCKNCFIGDDGLNAPVINGVSSTPLSSVAACNAAASAPPTCPTIAQIGILKTDLGSFPGSGGSQPDTSSTDPVECPYYRYGITLVNNAGAYPYDIKVTLKQHVQIIYDGGFQSNADYYADKIIPAGSTQGTMEIYYDYQLYPHAGGCNTTYNTFNISNVQCLLPISSPSSCASDPRRALYENKVRVFNEWVETGCLKSQGVPYASDGTGYSSASLDALRGMARDQVESLKAIWLSRLQAVRDEEFPGNAQLSDNVLNDLVNKLANVSLKYINDIANESNMRPVSTLPSGVTSSNGYNSFAAVFTAVVGSLTAQGFNQYLLEKPYPYDKSNFDSDPVITMPSTDVCTNLTNLKNKWTASGSSLTFSQYLAQQLGDDYGLTDVQLSDLQNKCTATCTRAYLNDALTIPVAFASSANTDHPNLSCSRVTALMSSFASAYPSITAAAYPKLYKLLVTNYLNLSTGYSLAYGEYTDFQQACTVNSTALLYDKPASPQVAPDNFTCAAGIMKDVFTRAGIEYDHYVEIIRRQFRNSYVSNCLAGQAGASMTGKNFEYHYTLYYYDQSGNLVKTIPPEGVELLTDQQIDQVEQLRLSTVDVTSCTAFPSGVLTDKTSILSNLSTGLQSGSAKAMELWLYSNSGTQTRQLRMLTPDNKYMYQVAAANGKLWVELYSLQPGSAGDISITLSNQVVADLSGQLPMQAWSHLFVQSAGGLTGGGMVVYLDGIKLPVVSGPATPPYPYAWEINAGYTLPAEDIAVIKHLRLYNRIAQDQEVMADFLNSCLAPADQLANSWQLWGRFDVPSFCNNTGRTTAVSAPNKGSMSITGLPWPSGDPGNIIANVSNTFTVEFWVNPQGPENFAANEATDITAGVHNHNYVIFPAYGGVAAMNRAGMGIAVGTNGVAIFEHADSYMPAKLMWQGSISGWTHIAVVYNNKTPSLYINGVFRATGTTSVKATVCPSYNFGGTTYGYMLGGLDEVRIWNTARTATQLSSNYNRNLQPSDQQGDLVGYWGMDGTGGATVQDITCNSLNANLSSAANWATTGAPINGTNYVEFAGHFIVPNHRLPTNYTYNSLNQVIRQNTPDAGTSQFWYDRLGRLAVSQNAEQKSPVAQGQPTNRYTYTRYDQLGRVTEVGEKINLSVSDGNAVMSDDMARTTGIQAASLNYWMGMGNNRQVMLTAYDYKPSWSPANITQSYLRKRVAATALLSQVLHPNIDPTLLTDGNESRQTASYYNYDAVGNTNTLVQENMSLINNEKQLVHGTDGLTGYKTIQYDYDLISGKVNKVMYQPGKWDQFNYQYTYDADNKLLGVFTRREGADGDPQGSGTLWTKEAVYSYYPHGPLARTELGGQVQGVDHAYTLQGWLKGVNGSWLNATTDMGQDGVTLSDIPHGTFARDAYAFSLNYYQGDYAPIGVALSGNPANAFNLQYQGGDNPPSGKNLFNGNIGSSTYALSKLESGNTIGYSYQYDQLNRLKAMNRHSLTQGASNWTNSSIVQKYAETISYDANGNIRTYNRRDDAGALMDSLVYGYNLDANGKLTNNKLRSVDDKVTNSPASYNDIKNGQAADNYTYDNIGNLIADQIEGIGPIQWTVNGKIQNVTKAGVRTIGYEYDASGNRISKSVVEQGSGVSNNTYYVLDAQGVVIAVYSYKVNTSTGLPSEGNWMEQHLYGSSRLGILNPNVKILSSAPLSADSYAANATIGPMRGLIGLRAYELTNHLGNVLATITDNKVAVSLGGGTTDHYEADIISMQDYYPFGMQMPGRTYVVSSSLNYRYGFNGKENDNEVKGIGNQIDYGMRVYDPRMGRFLSVDPLTEKYPFYTPYQFAGNDVIRNLDLDGAEPKPAITGHETEAQTQTTSEERVEGNESRVTTHYQTWVYHEGGVNGSKDGWMKEQDYFNDVLKPLTKSDKAEMEFALSRKPSNISFFALIDNAAEYIKKNPTYDSWAKWLPIWGSGVQAYMDFSVGKYGWGSVNTVLAISDVFLVKSFLQGAAKGGIKALFLGNAKWSVAPWSREASYRSLYLEEGFARAGQPAHHWLIQRNGPIGKYLPNAVKNQMFNLKMFANQADHMIYGHGKNYLGQRGANLFQQLWYGTPVWPKLTLASYGGRGLEFSLRN